MSNGEFFVNDPFLVTKNGSSINIPYGNNYDYILNVNIFTSNITSVNSIFQNRTFRLNQNQMDIDLTINIDLINQLLYNLDSVDISSSMNNVSNHNAYDTLTKQVNKKLGFRMLEIIATKIFAHAKARAAIANDTDYYLPYSNSNSIIKQIVDGVNNALFNKKNEIYNIYSSSNRFDHNENMENPINFNFSSSNWDFPFYFTTSLNGSIPSQLSNGPNVGGSRLINSQVTVPLLIRFSDIIT